MTSTFPSNRLVSLDVFRGLTIAGMIVVNDAGDWNHVYAPLRHADWHGITPTDLVFPFFLFIVGVSITLAYSKRLQLGSPQGELIKKIFKRTAILFGLGVFLWLFPKFDFGGVRFPGVLQRIALVFCACSLIFLKTDWKTQAWIGAGLLVGYWLIMTIVPVPIDEVIRGALESSEVQAQAGMISIAPLTQLSDGWIAANLEPGTNMEAWLDRMVIPFRLYQYTWDPEGLLSTLPAIGTGISGMLVGRLLLADAEQSRKVMWLMMAGFIAMTLGNVWDWFFPFNKNLWTSSYVLYTSGLAIMTLGAMYWLVDILKYDDWIFPFKVFGANAIAAYVLHGMVIVLFQFSFGPEGQTWSLQSAFNGGLTGLGLAPEFVSLLWALSYTGLIYGLVWLMYRRNIFLKI